MDIRTGETYDTREAALAAGVPESDIAEIVVRRDGTYWPKFANKKYPQPHQSSREMQRRQRQIAAVDGGRSMSSEAAVPSNP